MLLVRIQVQLQDATGKLCTLFPQSGLCICTFVQPIGICMRGSVRDRSLSAVGEHRLCIVNRHGGTVGGVTGNICCCHKRSTLLVAETLMCGVCSQGSICGSSQRALNIICKQTSSIDKCRVSVVYRKHMHPHICFTDQLPVCRLKKRRSPVATLSEMNTCTTSWHSTQAAHWCL